MYIEKSEFIIWMEKLSEKLDKIGKSLKELWSSSEVMKDDKLLDNQDLAFLLKVSYRTLQRHHTNKVFPYIIIGHKTYCASDIRNFVTQNSDCQTLERFNKKTKIKSPQ